MFVKSISMSTLSTLVILFSAFSSCIVDARLLAAHFEIAEKNDKIPQQPAFTFAVPEQREEIVRFAKDTPIAQLIAAFNHLLNLTPADDLTKKQQSEFYARMKDRNYDAIACDSIAREYFINVSASLRVAGVEQALGKKMIGGTEFVKMMEELGTPCEPANFVVPAKPAGTVEYGPEEPVSQLIASLSLLINCIR